VRLNALAISAILVVLLFLVNGQRVPIQIYFVSTHASLGVIMAASVAAGVALTFLFLSLGRSYRKILSKIKKVS